jgi:hypothetical protein
MEKAVTTTYQYLSIEKARTFGFSSSNVAIVWEKPLELDACIISQC